MGSISQPVSYTNGQIPHRYETGGLRSGVKGLMSNEEQRLLDVIDEVRDRLSSTQNIDLPQLVVCGDQSSGKSSVLEAISEIPFPRGENTCTRFVTEIRFKRSSKSYIRVGIQPYQSRGDVEGVPIKPSTEQGELSQLPALIEQASAKMGLSRDPQRGPSFSKDILKIEISGPDRQPLTLVDLPGLIVSDTRDGADIAMVKEIVNEWISNPRTIILAVLGANLDAKNQGILSRAKMVDPTGERTFGIITKPDLCPAGSQSRKYWVDLARNLQEFKSQKGWHVLHNRNFKEVEQGSSSIARNIKEREFFSNPTNEWNVIGEDNWGIESLRKRLSRLLYDWTRKTLPDVYRDISTEFDIVDAELDKLSAGLKSQEEMWTIFKERCNEMLEKAMTGASGKMNDPFFNPANPDNDRYLRSNIVKQGDKFAENMITKGEGIQFPQVKTGNLPEDDKCVDIVLKVLERTRGEELPGQTDPQRLDLLFWWHSEPWKDIATEHIKQCFVHCRSFINYIVTNLMPNDLSRLQAHLWREILHKALKERRDHAEKELKNLDRDRTRSTKTRVKAFLQESQQGKNDKLFIDHMRVEHLKRMPRNDIDPALDSNVLAEELGRSTLEGIERAEASQLLRDMLIYYDIARDEYVDNVMSKVIEQHLLANLHHIFRNELGLTREKFSEIWKDDDYDEREARRKQKQEQRDMLWDCLRRVEMCMYARAV